MKNLSNLFILAIALSFTACGDDDCNTVTLGEELSVTATAYAEANAAYFQDDSDENCETLKVSINAYLEANTKLTECDGLLSVGALGEAQLQTIEDQRDALPCN